MSRLVKERPRARNARASNTRQRRQQHLLDVKVRSHKATRHRNQRILVIVSKIGLCLAVCAGLFFGLRFGARKFFFENPDYRVSRIEVRTDGTLQREQILLAAGVREGVNIFSVNLARVSEQLLQLPQVDDVRVVRKMPSEIDIQVVERKPIAWITPDKETFDPFASENAFLVDARGVLIKQKELLPEYLGLPVIVGCSSETFEAGRIVDSFEAKAALDFLGLSTRSFMHTRFQVREIDVSKGYCLLVTDKNRTRVTFGFDQLDAQLQRLEQLLVHCDESKRELETVNLLVQRNIPVTFARLPSDIINDTIDPDGEEPRILKAIPVHPQTAGARVAAKPKQNASNARARKAIPIERGRRN